MHHDRPALDEVREPRTLRVASRLQQQLISEPQSTPWRPQLLPEPRLARWQEEFEVRALPFTFIITARAASPVAKDGSELVLRECISNHACWGAPCACSRQNTCSLTVSASHVDKCSSARAAFPLLRMMCRGSGRPLRSPYSKDMGCVALTVEDGFDVVFGKRRGVSSDHERERLRLIQDGTWEVLQIADDSERIFAVLCDLSIIAHDPTPEAKEHLRGAVKELIDSCGIGWFTTGWRLHDYPLPGSLQDAIRESLVSHLKDPGDGRKINRLREDEGVPYARRRAAHRLVESLFLDKEALTYLSRPQMEAHLPLIEAVTTAHKEESLAEEPADGEDQYDQYGYRKRHCRNLATCLALCPSDSLPLLTAWRDELTEEVAAGNCDTILSDLTMSVLSLRYSVSPKGVPVERTVFLRPLSEAIEKRR